MTTHVYSFFLFVYLLQLQLFRLLAVLLQNVSAPHQLYLARFLHVILTIPLTRKLVVLYQNKFQILPTFLPVYVAKHTKSWFGLLLPMLKNGFVVLFYRAKSL